MIRTLAPLILWTALAPQATPPSDPAGLAFEQHEIVTGRAARQTVVPGFFLGGEMADLAVLHLDENAERHLRIYALRDDSWGLELETTLRPGVLFVDVATIDGNDRLITYEPGRLSWFDPESATERTLLDVATSYNATPRGLHYASFESTEPFDEGEIPRVDITRDLNHDSLDDVIIPNVDGFSVYIQMEDGTFADVLRLGPPEPFRDAIGHGEKRTYGEVGISPLTAPLYLSRVHEMDYDRDGLSDLVFWNQDHFDVHLQDERGLFSPLAETFTSEVPFDSDGTYSLAFAFEGESAAALFFGFRKTTTRTVLHSFRDMNGDGVADLVTQSMQGRSLLKQRSLYGVHFGTPTAEGTVFAPDVAATIQTQGKAPPGYSSQWLEDFDGDDQIDVLYSSIRTGPGGMIRAMLGTSITLSCELYSLEDGVYPDRPTGRRKMKSDIKVRGGRDAGFWPASLVGDVNGDGRSDVVVGKNRQELQVFLGGQDMLARQPHKVTASVPGDERNSWLVDFNQDGKQDILMHHPSASEPHRVTVLIAR